MSGPSRKPRTNPFYFLLMFVSTLFVVTVLGYLVGPYVEAQAADGRAGLTSRALTAWFERKGILALCLEFVAMVVLAVMAMATDHLFVPAKTVPDRTSNPSG